MYCDINLVSEFKRLKQFKACIITSVKLKKNHISYKQEDPICWEFLKLSSGSRNKIMEVRRYKSVIRKILQILWNVSKVIQKNVQP